MIRLKAWPPPVTGETLAKFFQESNTWKYFITSVMDIFSFFYLFSKYKFHHDFYYNISKSRRWDFHKIKLDKYI
ncbi:hypothetical protein HanPI659440_Chr07g0256531 [Helianthus annuus]|nr:hypothetical protein HanPI659440_Chr07g0256531 [Helianthus annuus]